MVKKKILSAMAAAFVAVQLLGTTVITAQASTITGAVSTDNFIRGVDVSTLDMLEDLGAHYYEKNQESDYKRRISYTCDQKEGGNTTWINLFTFSLK